MGRTILSVVGSYFLLQSLVFAALALAWPLMGPDRAFLPGSWETTFAWSGLMIAVSLGAAVIGGGVCRLAAGDARAPMHLAMIVLIAGVLTAATAPGKSPLAGVDERGADVPMMEAVQKAIPPAWYAWAIAFAGPAGVVIGGRLTAGRRDAARGTPDAD